MQKLTNLNRAGRRAVVATASALAALAIALTGSPSAHAGIDTSRTYRITTSNSLALDVEGGATTNSARVIQWGINGGLNQRWQFHPLGDGWYEIVSVNSGKCLTVGGTGLLVGAGVMQYWCRAAPTQRWRVAYAMSYFGPNLISLQVASSMLFLDVPGGTGAWGTQLVQWTDSGTYAPQQLFALTVLY